MEQNAPSAAARSPNRLFGVAHFPALPAPPGGDGAMRQVEICRDTFHGQTTRMIGARARRSCERARRCCGRSAWCSAKKRLRAVRRKCCARDGLSAPRAAGRRHRALRETGIAHCRRSASYRLCAAIRAATEGVDVCCAQAAPGARGPRSRRRTEASQAGRTRQAGRAGVFNPSARRVPGSCRCRRVSETRRSARRLAR